MIAGRLHWRQPDAKLAGRNDAGGVRLPRRLAGADRSGHEAPRVAARGPRRSGLQSLDPGGIDVFASDLDAFRAALTAENRTLKRALTDPRIVSGIGNAYSDEILHAAQLSPIALTHKLTPRGMGAAVRRDARRRCSCGSTGCARSRRRVSRKRHRVSQGHGGARPLRQAVPALRRAGPAHPVRRQRNELLRGVPNGRQAAGRSQPVATLRADWPRTLEELDALKRR